MINDIARRSVHVDAANNIPIATVKEYDDFILKLSLLKYNTPFDCTGQTATLGVKAPSGLFEQTTDIIINKDQIDIKLKTGIISKAGTCAMELKLVDSTGSMTTASFFIAVNRKILNDEAVEASDEFDSLTEAKKMEPIRQENELKRQENEKGRVEAEKLRVQSETDRAAAEEIREQQELARQTCYKEIEESRMDFDGGIHKNLKLRLMRDFGDIYNRFNEANLLPYEAEYISASNSYKGMTTDNVVKGRTLQNLIKNVPWILSNDKGSAYMNVDWGLLKPNTNYTFIVFNPSPKIDLAKGYVGKNFVKTSYNDISKPLLLTTVSSLPAQGVLQPHIYAKSGTLIDDDVANTKLVLIEGDYTNKPIPPYFEGIKSVNEDGENLEQVSCGKNLFNPNYLKTVEGTTYEVLTKDGRECLKPTSNFHNTWYQKILFNKFKPNTQYTISYDVFYEGDKVGLYPAIKYTDGTSFVLATNGFNAWNTKQFTTPIGKSVESIFFVYSYGTPTYFDLNSFKLNEGTSIAEEPYQEHRLPIKMKNLRSLPNGICDTSDGVRRIEKIIIDGSQDIKLESINANGIANFYIILTQLGTSVAICDKLLIDNSFIANAIREGFIIVNSNTLYIRILSSKVSTVTAAKLYFKNNPHTFYYELATSTTEEGNTEELRTYDGTTNIFTEGSLIEPTISCKVPSNVQAVVMNLREENKTLNNDVNTLQATTEENNLMNIETNVNQEARLTMLELGVI